MNKLKKENKELIGKLKLLSETRGIESEDSLKLIQGCHLMLSIMSSMAKSEEDKENIIKSLNALLKVAINEIESQPLSIYDVLEESNSKIAAIHKELSGTDINLHNITKQLDGLIDCHTKLLDMAVKKGWNK